VNVPYAGPKLGADCSEYKSLCASLRSTIDNRAELLERQRSVGTNRILKNGATERTERKTYFVFFVSTVFSVTPFLRSGCSVPSRTLRVEELRSAGGWNGKPQTRRILWLMALAVSTGAGAAAHRQGGRREARRDSGTLPYGKAALVTMALDERFAIGYIPPAHGRPHRGAHMADVPHLRGQALCGGRRGEDVSGAAVVACSGGTSTGAFGTNGARWDEYVASQRNCDWARSRKSVPAHLVTK
jgi:hypothetical protein